MLFFPSPLSVQNFWIENYAPPRCTLVLFFVLIFIFSIFCMYNFVGNFLRMYNWTSLLWIGETVYGNPILWQWCQKCLNVDLELQITNRAILQDVITSHDSYFHVDIFLSFCFFNGMCLGRVEESGTFFRLWVSFDDCLLSLLAISHVDVSFSLRTL